MGEHNLKRNPKNSQNKLQEDEERCPRMPKNTLQALNPQEIPMVESLKKHLLGKFGKVGLKALKLIFKGTKM